MSINNHWRNKQLGIKNALLVQEQVCLNFLTKHPNINWSWVGIDDFKPYCDKKVTFDGNHPTTGLIIINYPHEVTPKTFVHTINNLIGPETKVVYLAINRFCFLPVNDLNIDYHDSIEVCIDQIVEYISVPFRRHYTGSEIDGNHFVGVHGLDIFVYESNN